MNKKLIYQNPLSRKEDMTGFVLEGEAGISFESARMKLISTLDPELGQIANYVYWCPEIFPSDIEISWNFYPMADDGLCMMFFAATGMNGKDLFDPSLAPRDGQYNCYHSGDINTFHASYFRRKAKTERAFRTCNLRKSKGFHLVKQGADPIPEVADCMTPYRIKIVKYKNSVQFFINDMLLYTYLDDESHGGLLQGGRIGFRQMSPMIAEYSNLTVYALSETEEQAGAEL